MTADVALATAVRNGDRGAVASPASATLAGVRRCRATADMALVASVRSWSGAVHVLSSAAASARRALSSPPLARRARGASTLADR